jgi:hypothetical protein
MNIGGTKPKDDAAFARTEPAISTLMPEPRTLAEVRKLSRLLLAERYERLTPQSLPPEIVRYPEMQRRCYIEGISMQPEILKEFHRQHEKKVGKVVKTLKGMLRHGGRDERGMAAVELSLIASDPEIYGKDSSVRALRTLVVEALERSSQEAKTALLSMGLGIEEIPRTEIVALTSSPLRLLLNKDLKAAMRSLERRLEERG